jgi:hypothetical protein
MLGPVAVKFRAMENRSRLFSAEKMDTESQVTAHNIEYTKYYMYAEFKSIRLILFIFQDQC